MTLLNTVDALLNRVRRDAMLTLRGPLFTVASPYTAGATSLFVNEDPAAIGAGTILAVDTELFYVTAVDQATKKVTVLPGFLGSTQANHDANAMVEVDPRVPKATLLDHAQQEILSWEGQLWRTLDTEVEVVSTERTYPLDITAAYFLLDARIEPESQSATLGFRWNDDAWPRVEARLLRDMPAADFPSGFGLQLTHLPRRPATVRVAYAAPFDLSAFTTSTDLVSTVGVRPQWFDVLELGVRHRALSASLLTRSDHRASGMSRNAEEVSLIDVIRTVDMARSQRDRRLADAGVELRREWPYRRS